MLSIYLNPDITKHLPKFTRQLCDTITRILIEIKFTRILNVYDNFYHFNMRRLLSLYRGRRFFEISRCGKGKPRGVRYSDVFGDEYDLSPHTVV